jgi:hypothetical protein
MLILTSPPLPPVPLEMPLMRSARSWAVLALAACALALAQVCLSAVGAQSGSPDANLERNVKAAFLYKFLGYVEFPESAAPPVGEPLAIGVLGADDLAEELERIVSGRNMNGHALVVHKLRAGDNPARFHLLFIGDEESADGGKALAAVRQLPVLTVTDSERGLRQGSVINFRVIEDRVRFEVALDAAEKSNLKLSSRLLAVAAKVQRGSR